MRSLILTCLLLPLVASAEGTSYKFATNLKEESGTTGLSTTNAVASSSEVTSVELATGVIAPSRFPHFDVRFGLDQTKPDYRRYLITGKNGSSFALSDLYSAPEYSGRAAFDLYFKDITLAFEGGGSLTTAPFPGTNTKAAATYDLRDYGASFSASLARSDLSLPASYFIDPETFQTRLRPGRLLETRVSTAWEQILAERWKSRVQFDVADRPASRPGLVSSEVSLAYALTDTSALLGKAGLARERRNSTLFDDRGYLDATWARLEYRMAPSFQWEVDAGLGTILETETARGNLPLQRVGTDTLSVAARKQGHAWEAGVKSLAAFSNTGYQSLQFGGDFSWSWQ